MKTILRIIFLPINHNKMYLTVKKINSRHYKMHASLAWNIISDNRQAKNNQVIAFNITRVECEYRAWYWLKKFVYFVFKFLLIQIWLNGAHITEDINFPFSTHVSPKKKRWKVQILVVNLFSSYNWICNIKESNNASKR